MNDKKNVLVILPSLTQTNGIASFVFNYLSHIKDNEMEFTILSGDLRPSKFYLDSFEKMGVNVFLIPNIKSNGFIKYHKALKRFFKANHNYDIVYSNAANQSLFIFKLAKKYKIKNRILHSHATSSAPTLLKRMRNNLLVSLTLRYSTHFFACSEYAGKAMFGNRSFTIINNAIEYEKYTFNSKYREKVRNQYHISSDEKVIGFVGRMAEQKNIFYLIDLCKFLPVNYTFFVVGNGDLKDAFVSKLEEENLTNRFRLVEESSTVNELYSAMDLFVLPSFYEGLPVVGIEAQVNGLPCFFSKSITSELRISDYCYFLDLKDLNSWISNMQRPINRCQGKYLSEQFDINVQSQNFSILLKKIINNGGHYEKDRT